MRDAPPPPSRWASGGSSRVSVRESRDPETVPAPAARSSQRRLPTTTTKRTGLEGPDWQKEAPPPPPSFGPPQTNSWPFLRPSLLNQVGQRPLSPSTVHLRCTVFSLAEALSTTHSLFPVALLPRGRRTPRVRAGRTSVDPVRTKSSRE